MVFTFAGTISPAKHAVKFYRKPFPAKRVFALSRPENTWISWEISFAVQRKKSTHLKQK
jgi:hypothetical protein